MQLFIKAFSLIELMVVIAIVAILAAIAVPTYQAYIDKTKYSTAMDSLQPYVTAMKNVYAKKGNFSIGVADLGLTPSGNSLQTPQPGSLSDFVVQPYLAVVETSGSQAASGRCLSIGITGRFTNFGDGDIYTNGLSQGKLMELTYAFYEVKDTLVPICSYVIYQFPSVTFVHPNINGCYDLQNSTQSLEYSNAVAALNAKCP